MEISGIKYPFGPLPQIESPDAKNQAVSVQKESANETVEKADKVEKRVSRPSFKTTLERKGMELDESSSAGSSEENKLEKAAQDLEAYFIYSILKKFNSANIKGGLFGQETGSDIYMDMFFEKVADQMASTGDGLGIAKEIVESAKTKMEIFESLNPASTEDNINQNFIIDRIKDLKT